MPLDVTVRKFYITSSTGVADADMEEIHLALYDHFSNVSTKFGISSSAGAGPNNFTVTCSAAGEDWQVNFRRASSSTTTTKFSMCSGTGSLGVTEFASPGTTAAVPVTTARDHSNEVDWTIIASNVAKSSGPNQFDIEAVIVEVDDAFFLLLEDDGTPSGSFYPYGVHFGKVWVPFYASDPGLGRDGLGFHLGIPSDNDATAQGWINDDANTNNRTRIHVIDGQVSGTVGSISHDDCAFQYRYGETLPTDATSDLDGIEKPRPIRTKAMNSSLQRYRNLGYSKYLLFYNSTSERTVKDTLVTTGGDFFLCVGEAAGQSALQIPWSGSAGVPIPTP
jgi:hypothetical protein